MAEWYYAANRKEMGPVPLAELQRLARQGLLQPTDLVWKDGMSDWARASTRRELFADNLPVVELAPPLTARVVELGADRQPLGVVVRRDETDGSEQDVDNDDGDRRRPRRSRRGWPLGVKVGLIVGSIVLVLLLAGIALFVLLRPFGSNAIAAGIGDFPGVLAANDPRDQVTGGPSRVHMVNMIQGRTYVIELRSQQFDSFLRLEDGAFRQLAQDDDSGGGVNGLDARIVFPCTQSGNYRIIVTSLNRLSGAYTLAIRQH